MILMVEKRIRGGICHAIHRCTKANKKYMKQYDKYKESSCLKYWDVNNVYSWAMLQKLPVEYFQWIDDTSQVNKNFIKLYIKESDSGYFLDIFFNILKNYINFIMIYNFHLKE